MMSPSLALLLLFGSVVAKAVDILHYDGFVPEVEELVESNIAPLLAYDDGLLYTSGNSESGAAVCGTTANITPRMVFPITLKKLDSMHRRVQQGMPWSGTMLDLNMVEGCYTKYDEDGEVCAASLQSLPKQCGMDIESSTMYWAYRVNQRSPVAESTKVFENGASVLVEDILYIRPQREELRRAIRLNKEFNKAGAELFEIARRGWKLNTTEEDQQAFRHAVSARGTQMVKEAYSAAMRKWKIVKQWLKTSIGKVDRQVPTFTAVGNGTLLSMDVCCNVAERIDDWMPITDRNLYIPGVHGRSYSELLTFFRGTKVNESSKERYPNVNHLPCAAVSLAVAMMLHDDFPVRLLYQNITGEANTETLWPWARFEELSTVTTMSPKYRSYTMKQFAYILNYTLDHSAETGRFGGGLALAECVTRSILRITGRDGLPPQPSLFDCYSPAYNQSRMKSTDNEAPPSKYKWVAGGEGMESYAGTPCPWGFTRASGNLWSTREPCVVCPPGSFSDGEGGCRCSSASYPTLMGCMTKRGRYPIKAKWKWLGGPMGVRVANRDNGQLVPLLVVKAPPNAEDGDQVKVLIECTKGLTEFKAVITSTQSNSSKTELVDLPVERNTYIFTTSNTTISLDTSAAFGGDQCNFSTKVVNPKYSDSPVVQAGTLLVLPPVAELRNTALPVQQSSANAMAVEQLANCTSEVRNDPGSVGIALCVTHGQDVSVRIGTHAYTPLTNAMWHILKRSVWTNGAKAKELGKLMKPVVERMRLAVKVTFKCHGNVTTVGEAFSGNIAVGRAMHTVGVKSNNISELVVTTQIVDFCTTEEGVHHTSCAGSRHLFIASDVSNVTFFLAPRNNTEGHRADDDDNDEGRNESAKKPHEGGHDEGADVTQQSRMVSGMLRLRVPLIALGAVDALLVAITAAITVLYYARYRKTALPEVEGNP
ncbi:uncharacterized protein TEOVI_000472000 [Trypanosoma equiperdum]|uniref:Uncharacterized protein n=1 Tax=Trypanosoma equiperdum TaxID=5694 RepID=A0A1G4I4M7_TRYEQ|nr:hypothetical protein, conserved [Trypanosoma equiperdum]